MLRNTNYYDKRTGLTLSVVALAHVDTKNGTATFLIGVNRQAIASGKIIDKVKIDVDYNRNVNPFKQAYDTAKGQKTVRRWNTETGKAENVIVNQPFYGWADEIV